MTIALTLNYAFQRVAPAVFADVTKSSHMPGPSEYT